jgi:hypothetical protein
MNIEKFLEEMSKIESYFVWVTLLEYFDSVLKCSPNKKEIPCTTEARSTLWNFCSTEYNLLYFRNIGLLLDAGWWANAPLASKGLKIRIFEFFPKILIERVPSCLTFEIWDFGQMMASMGQWSSKAQNWDFLVYVQPHHKVEKIALKIRKTNFQYIFQTNSFNNF